jgi:hypothetical protein
MGKFLAVSLAAFTFAILLGHGAHSASSQSSRPADMTSYLKIKAVVEKLAQENKYPLGSQGDLKTAFCDPLSVPFDATHLSTPQNRDLLDVAGAVLFWRTNLSDAGYPSTFWEPVLLKIESAAVDKVGSGIDEDKLLDYLQSDGETLFKLIKQYNSTPAGKNLPPPSDMGECGAGGPVDIYLATSPAGGAISVISEFEYELCALDLNSGNDMSSCSAWRRVNSDGKLSVSGIYYIKVSWGDKDMPPTKYDFDDASLDKTYTLTHP